MNKHNQTAYLYPAAALVLILLAAIAIIVSKKEPAKSINWISSWKPLNHFTFPRRALTAVTARGYLYVIGGVDAHDNYVKTTEYAEILPDGTLGTWRATQPLNMDRFYLAAVSVGNYLYVMGGGTGKLGEDNLPTASVERARINADGSLSPWQNVPSMLTPRRGLKAVAYNQHIYAIGGYSGIFLKSIEYSKVDSDGNITQWVLDPNESTIDRYIHSAALYENQLYLLGGHVEKSDVMSYGDVERTTIMSNGSLERWEIVQSRLQIPRFIASAFAANRYLYILGGHNGGLRLNSVEKAPIYTSGQIGQWQQTTPLLTERSATAVATQGKYVYVLGGMSNNAVLNSVEMAVIGTHGDPGHPADS